MSTVTLDCEPTRSPDPSLARLRARIRRPKAQAILMWIALPMAITLLGWQPVDLMPAPGLDKSWTAGLAMGIHNGVSFGDHLIFTYGPLGFLGNPTLWYGGLGIASFAYTFLIRFGLALTLFTGSRRTFGATVSFVIAIAVAAVDSQLVEPVIVLIAMVGALVGERGRRRPLELSVLAGALCGIELLNKISIGVTLVAMTGVFVLSLPRRRRDCAVAAAVTCVVSLVVCWLATGQPLAALPDYVTNSVQIVSGYSAAMEVAVGGLGWQSTAALLGLALGLWGAIQMSVNLPSRQRWGLCVLWLVFWFFIFKEGFVRHEAGHAAVFFAGMLGGFVAFGWRPGSRLIGLVCTGMLLTMTLAAQGHSLGTDLHPTRSVRVAVDQVRDILSSSRREAIAAAGRAAVMAADALDPRALSLLRGHTAAVYPSEIALAWAYGLIWNPLPVLQSYSAYTSALDDVDARFLNSSRAPQRIILHLEPGVDGRVATFDEGRTIRTMLCRYRDLYAAGPIAVLGLGANRCSSSPTPLATVRADWGQTIPVPPPPNNHSLVFVRIGGVDVAGLERVRALLFKPAERFVAINSGTRRLVPGTAGDGLPLRASPDVDFAPPFNVAAGATTIAAFKQGQGRTGGQPISFSFYTQTFAAGSAEGS